MTSKSEVHLPSPRALHLKHVARTSFALGRGSQVALFNNALEAHEGQSNSPISSSLVSSTVVSGTASATSIAAHTDSVAPSISSSLPMTSTSLTSNSLGSASTGAFFSVFSSQSGIPTSATASSWPTPSSLTDPVVTSTATVFPSASSLPISVAVVVDNPSNTPEPSAVATSTTSVTQSPVFYIGIILGVVIIVACVSTVVAWWLRVRNRDSRKTRELHARVPWARSDTVSSGFFGSNTTDGHITSSPDLEKAEIEDAMSLRRGESEKLKLHLELMGDRDVGMPKRTQSFIENANSPVKRRSLPILTVPSPPPSHRDDSVISPNGPLPESVAYPLPAAGKRRSLPVPPSPSYHPSSSSAGSLHSYLPPPSHPSTQCLHPEHRMQPQSLNQQQFPAEFGTPREVVVEPRFIRVLEAGKRSGSLRSVEQHTSTSASVIEMPTNESIEEAHPQETWTDSLRNRMMSVLGYQNDTSHGSLGNERYTNLPFPTPARARRASLRRAGWVQHIDTPSDGMTSRNERTFPTEHQLCNPFDDPHAPAPIGLGIMMPYEVSSGPPSSISQVYVPKHTSHPHFQLNSAVSSGHAPSEYASSLQSCGSAAPLIIRKKNPSISSGPLSRASSRYSVVSRTGSVMTVLTEKEEAAGRALRARWARGEARRPGMI
ncbi:hypothetical protein PQX77_008401 [Marasmius sp. AFHP31]|nr:hypothetical protein PQX77_013014 [Marasmius sp. AFHP31]KAK1228536.1 hypothetical protein PQX77_008401 [Marasmius sp. AFHP31]